MAFIHKGDSTDQHRKILNSGIVDHFWAVEVVREKTPHTYGALLQRHRVEPTQFTMVGNSVKSDVLPVLAIGGWAIHVPHTTTWVFEEPDPDELAAVEFPIVDRLGDVPGLLAG